MNFHSLKGHVLVPKNKVKTNIYQNTKVYNCALSVYNILWIALSMLLIFHQLTVTIN